MEKKQKTSLSEHLVKVGLIALFCFGGIVLISAVGFGEIAKTFAIIIGVTCLFLLIATFSAKAAYHCFVGLLAMMVLYAFGGLNLIYYIIGIPAIVLVYWSIYKIGDRFGWWKPVSWNK